MENAEVSPVAVVQRQLDAYNARDLEALLDTYAEDAELFEFPGTLVARGRGALRTRFALRFKEPNLHARLCERIQQGTTVIDQEEVTRTFPDGPGILPMIMIYQVECGRIRKAWTIVGTSRTSPEA